MKFLKLPILISLLFSATISHADDQSVEVLAHLKKTMPNTVWTGATELESFPGYYHLSFEGRDIDTQYYFDADKKILIVGMMVNLNVGSRRAKEQSIAPGSNSN